jgi:hypothetical protein
LLVGRLLLLFVVSLDPQSDGRWCGCSRTTTRTGPAIVPIESAAQMSYYVKDNGGFSSSNKSCVGSIYLRLFIICSSRLIICCCHSHQLPLLPRGFSRVLPLLRYSVIVYPAIKVIFIPNQNENLMPHLSNFLKFWVIIFFITSHIIIIHEI